MKYLLLQHWDHPDRLGELEKLSKDNMMKYAKQCGADYQLITGTPFHPSLSAPCQKCHMISEEFDVYDVVVMTDLDMFTVPGIQENIFETTGYGRHYGIQEILVKGLKRRFPRLGDPSRPYWGGSTYRMPLDLRKRLRKHVREEEIIQFHNNLEDEGIFHRLAVLAKIPVDKDTYFDKDVWNRSSFEPELSGANFIHIRPKVTPKGPKRPKIENYRELVRKGIL